MSQSHTSDQLPKSRVLDQVMVPNPCPMSWDAMDGDDRVRLCSQCNRHVWNFFEMTDREIRQVLRDHPERLCVKIVKTTDGKLLTKDHRPARPKFRFSMLSMMAVATCLSPLILYYPTLYRWLMPEPEPEPTKIYLPDINVFSLEEMIGRMPPLNELQTTIRVDSVEDGDAVESNTEIENPQ